MTLEEAITKVDALINAIETEMANISEEVAMNAMGLIVNRIQQQGIEGRTYSTNPLPAFYFEDRALNAGGRKLLEKEDKRLLRKGINKLYGEENVKMKKSKVDDSDGISYKEWREANGLQTSHVDLTYTGRMFQNIGVVGTVKRGDAFVTIIGGFDKEVKDKLLWNARRFGDFFVPTEDEKKLLEQVFVNRTKELVKKIGL